MDFSWQIEILAKFLLCFEIIVGKGLLSLLQDLIIKIYITTGCWAQDFNKHEVSCLCYYSINTFINKSKIFHNLELIRVILR